MSEKILPDIQQTAVEKVLIKHRAISALHYAKRIEQQTRQYAKKHIQQAQNDANTIQQLAYQQGYRHGLAQLLSNIIQSFELSEIHYQQKLKQSQENLLQQLSELFHDPRLQEIIADYFIQQKSGSNQITLYLPEQLKNKFNHTNEHINFSSSLEGEIALETEDGIIHFSPTIAAEQVVPQILSTQSRCQILAERKLAYQNMIGLFNKGDDDDNAQHD